MKPLSLASERAKNLYYWELLYLLSKWPVHPGRGLDLLGTKVLQ
jgi:hypothetical protein